MGIPEQILVEADLFLSYLTGDKLEPNFSRVVEKAENEETELLPSSEVYDDVILMSREDTFQISDLVGDESGPKNLNRIGEDTYPR